MEALALAEPVAVTLVRRGYRTVDQAQAFLEATEAHDPFEFDSMEEVTERIRGRSPRGARLRSMVTTTAMASARPRSSFERCASWVRAAIGTYQTGSATDMG